MIFLKKLSLVYSYCPVFETILDSPPIKHSIRRKNMLSEVTGYLFEVLINSCIMIFRIRGMALFSAKGHKSFTLSTSCNHAVLITVIILV